MLLVSLNDDDLLNLYRTLPPGSELLDSVHSEITRRGEGVWGRIEAVCFQIPEYFGANVHPNGGLCIHLS